MIVAPASFGFVANPPRDLEAVHVRHVRVEQHERETAVPRTRASFSACSAAAPLSTAVGSHVPAQQQVVQDAPVDLVVVDDRARADS